MSKYRNKLQIVASILSSTESEAKKTHIMYQANLSYKLLNIYLNKVLKAGLVQFFNNSYKITHKGEIFLEKFYEYSERREQLQKRIEDLNKGKSSLEDMI